MPPATYLHDPTDLPIRDMRPIPLLLSIAFGLSACSYATETVFTRQNQAAAALAMTVMEAERRDPGETDVIYSAEEDPNDACASRQDVASRRMLDEPADIESAFLALLSLSRYPTKKRARLKTLSG
jgi:hypothetical protein